MKKKEKLSILESKKKKTLITETDDMAISYKKSCVVYKKQLE